MKKNKETTLNKVKKGQLFEINEMEYMGAIYKRGKYLRNLKRYECIYSTYMTKYIFLLKKDTKVTKI